MKPANAHAALLIQNARRTYRSVWVRDRRTKAVVGYLTPDGVLVRIANAGILYARAMRLAREDKS